MSRTDTERMNWLEEHSVDWDAGLGAYFPWMSPPISHKGTLRDAVDKAMDAEIARRVGEDADLFVDGRID